MTLGNEPDFVFSWANLRREYEKLLELGYTVVSCREFAEKRSSGEPLPDLTLINRVDVDFSMKKAGILGSLFRELDITATFFVRLHAPEYNPFSFENYRVLRELTDSGFEIGLHSETIDAANIWGEDPVDCFERDLQALRTISGAEIVGSACHGGRTGFNNLDFWRDRVPADFGLTYEAYSDVEPFNLFQSSTYVSDSPWTYWKTYVHGALDADSRRSPSQVGSEKPPLLYLLVHPDTYFERHVYDHAE